MVVAVVVIFVFVALYMNVESNPWSAKIHSKVASSERGAPTERERLIDNDADSDAWVENAESRDSKAPIVFRSENS